MPDFDQWALALGIDTSKQSEYQKANLIILEGLYDLIIENKQQIEELQNVS